MKQLFWVFLMSLAALVTPAAQARTPPAVIARPLKLWQPWVMDSHRDLLCAGLGEGRACEWPGHLRVQIDGQRGEFTLDVWLDMPGNAWLPG